MTQGESARDCAFRILTEYDGTGIYLNTVLSSGLAGSSLERRDRALVTEIVQGTVRMKLALDHALQQFSNRSLSELDPGVLWLLRMAAYQLMFTSVPAYAACDLAVTVARHRLGAGPAAFVNGVLRALVRGADALDWPDREKDPLSYLEVRHSHPRWVVETWVDELGFDRTESLCVADNLQPLLCFRVNLLRTSREELATSLSARGIEVEPGSLAPEALLVKGAGSLAELDEFAGGMFAVQDQGPMAVGHLVAPEPGMRVLDMCSAPGGKANHLAELMGNLGSVIAVDINPRRLEMVRESAARLGNTIIDTVDLVATAARGAVDGFFDRVLVDAPCTGLGTLARRPDTRWRKARSDVERLHGLQRALMAEGSRMVAPGGLLVYSTCTISRRENHDVVLGFLDGAEGEGYELVPTGESPGFTMLFADTHGCDGMFIAVLRRED